MIDTQKLKKAIKQFERHSHPTSGNGNSQATIEDINKLIKETSKVLTEFVTELEQKN